MCCDRSPTFSALVALFRDPQALRQADANGDSDAVFTAIDLEEQSAGYQAAYSRLAASEVSVADPLGDIVDVRAWVDEELAHVEAESGAMKELLAQSGGVMALGPK